jgi:hypothetical protein
VPDCRARLPGKTAGQDCRASLPGKTAGQACRASLPGNSAGQACRASLPGKPAGQACRASLPGKPAWRACRASLPCKTAGQDCVYSWVKSKPSTSSQIKICDQGQFDLKNTFSIKEDFTLSNKDESEQCCVFQLLFLLEL